MAGGVLPPFAELPSTDGEVPGRVGVELPCLSEGSPVPGRPFVGCRLCSTGGEVALLRGANCSAPGAPGRPGVRPAVDSLVVPGAPGRRVVDAGGAPVWPGLPRVPAGGGVAFADAPGLRKAFGGAGRPPAGGGV
ncbi:hypothetical protein E1211_31635, partial [Micromonospora sp. 15K316]